MSKELTNPTFDYSTVSKDEASKLMWFAAEIRKEGATHVQSGLEMGRLLSEARDLCGETSFKSWVAAECGCSLRTAYNYMAAHAEFGTCATVARIELGAMYVLTKNDRAKKKALKLADKGITVTQSLAKELVAEATKQAGGGGGRSSSAGGSAARNEPPPASDIDPDTDPDTDPDEIRISPAELKAPYDRCPNCAGTRWTEDDEGWACAKCHHPYGEPAGDVDEDRIKIQRQKTVKTCEALLRAFDDLHLLLPLADEHIEAVACCKSLLKIAKWWK